MIASRGEPAIYSIRFFGRRRQCIIVTLNLEDAGPWYSLFIPIDRHEHFPLPPISVSDQSDACVRADPQRSEDARTGPLALLFALSGNEGFRSGCAQGLPITAPLELAAIQDTRSWWLLVASAYHLTGVEVALDIASRASRASVILDGTACLHSLVRLRYHSLGYLYLADPSRLNNHMQPLSTSWLGSRGACKPLCTMESIGL